jgi:hypothetical protein
MHGTSCASFIQVLCDSPDAVQRNKLKLDGTPWREPYSMLSVKKYTYPERKGHVYVRTCSWTRVRTRWPTGQCMAAMLANVSSFDVLSLLKFQ